MRGNKWCAVYRREDRLGVLSVARSDYKDEIRVVKTKAPLRGSPFRCCLSNITFVLDNSSFNANAHGIFV